MNKILQYIKKEAVLYIALTLALVSSLVIKPSLKMVLHAVDWRVLSLLFCLMAVVAAFRKYNVLDVLAVSILRRCKTNRSLYTSLICIVFFASMAVTNDVALLTFVPLTLILCSKAGISSARIIILETIAANLGSAVTPMGNPQNLFLYNYYTMETTGFFSHTLLIGIPSLIMLLCTVILISKKKESGMKGLTIEHISLKSPVKVTASGFVLIVILLSVFRVLDYRISLIVTVLYLLICERSIFSKIDYSLLCTFIGFFIFTEHMSRIEAVSSLLKRVLETDFSVYVSGIGISQIISNVPAALLLSGFTGSSESLLLGVNVGGLGTLIASLASVISYKLFTADQSLQKQEPSPFLAQFMLYNAVFLVILIPLVWLLKTVLL